MAIKHINPSQLKERLDSGDKIHLIDCREQEEWNQGHIAQAKLYPLSNFSLFMEETKDKNTEIIIHCRMGGRSMKALLMLEEQGYENLTNLDGGITSWIEQGHSISQ